MNNPQRQLQEFLDQLVKDGREHGVQVTAYHKGELVLDAWAGVADPQTGTPVDAHTLFPAYSTTKGLVATVIHQLVEAGQLSYETPIVKYWPEFGANGKDTITLHQALNHTAGIPFMPPGIGLAEIADWDVMCRAIAQLKPATLPGQHFEYHALTYGWILGEVARRVDGRPFAQIMYEDICAPLEIKDLYLGLPENLSPRVARIDEPEPALDPSTDPNLPRSVPLWLTPLSEWMNKPIAHRTGLPASNGIMSARAIARHYAALLPGGVDGIELLPPQRVQIAGRLHKPENIAESALPMRMGLGYQVGGPGTCLSPTAFGHGGYGGSLGFADPAKQFACGFTKNFFSKQGATEAVVNTVRSLLQIS